jgi:hypothetical protein
MAAGCDVELAFNLPHQHDNVELHLLAEKLDFLVVVIYFQNQNSFEYLEVPNSSNALSKL